MALNWLYIKFVPSTICLPHFKKLKKKNKNKKKKKWTF
jgi:hypothetical protein